ncbi:hypothetical protein L1281_000260 [Neisseria sp. HSC-16F19]|nr:hypothetical protein [Neisseria sp. HSC-16F19]MCP2039690.1 hypothetical protein [Neisseria sp. HSC-16F19]
MSASLIGILGAIAGGVTVVHMMGSKAARLHPELWLDVPEGAEHSEVFQSWAKENGYVLKNGAYTKGNDLFNSSTEIRFEGSRMSLLECSNSLIAKNRFAVNAPVNFGKAWRRKKLAKINELLAQWQLPPLDL